MNLPFTRSEFFDVFAAFNRSCWPVVVLLWLVSCWAAIAVARAHINARALTTLVAVQWLWSGIVYHAWFFARINPGARLFAVVFVVQGLLFGWAAVRNRLAFAWDASLRQFAGLGFLALSLAYPLLVLADGHRFPAAPAFGVPCPTTLFTAGVLLCATSPVPRLLIVGPVAWTLVGGSAALLFGMTPDLLLLAAAACIAPLALPEGAQHQLSGWFAANAKAAKPMSGLLTTAHPRWARVHRRGSVRRRP